MAGAGSFRKLPWPLMLCSSNAIAEQLLVVRNLLGDKYIIQLWCLQTIGCGLVGVPPVNGVLPQAPMHTKALATLKQQIVRGALQKSRAPLARRCSWGTCLCHA